MTTESPRALSDKIKAADKLRSKIAAAEQKIAPLKAEQKELEAEILHDMLEAKTEQVRAAGGGLFTVQRDTIPSVIDWPALDAYILKTKNLSLLHRRLTATAWAQLIENGKEVPGVKAQDIVKLAYSKPKAK